MRRVGRVQLRLFPPVLFCYRCQMAQISRIESTEPKFVFYLHHDHITAAMIGESRYPGEKSVPPPVHMTQVARIRGTEVHGAAPVYGRGGQPPRESAKVPPAVMMIWKDDVDVCYNI
jgi:hypothetical protein